MTSSSWAAKRSSKCWSSSTKRGGEECWPRCAEALLGRIAFLQVDHYPTEVFAVGTGLADQGVPDPHRPAEHRVGVAADNHLDPRHLLGQEQILP